MTPNAGALRRIDGSSTGTGACSLAGCFQQAGMSAHKLRGPPMDQNRTFGAGWFEAANRPMTIKIMNRRMFAATMPLHAIMTF